MAYPLHSQKTVRLGKGFGDSVDARRRSLSRSSSGISIATINRATPLIIFIFGFVVLTGKLFYLTIVEGSYYQQLGKSNSIREERIPAQRGVIYDRHGVVLAENRPIYKIHNTQKSENTLHAREFIYLSREEALEREARGEDVIHALGREYLFGPATAHVIGYMSEINEDQLAEQNEKIATMYGYTREQYCYECYGSGDLIGASGIESVYEERIRGVPGKRLVEVDALGDEVRELARVEPVSGESIHLSLDIHIQVAAVNALETMRSDPEVVSPGGAVVVTDVATGAIRGLYSSPTYDPNLFVGTTIDSVGANEMIIKGGKLVVEHRDDTRQGTDEEFIVEPSEVSDRQTLSSFFPLHMSTSALLSDTSNPMFDRALTGLYPPGSTFKIITATAGLEEGVIDKSTLVEDTGVLRVGPYSYGNWYFSQYGRTEGEINIIRALARSNDIFFYKVGEWLQIDRLAHWAHIFHADETIDTELEGEAAGVVRRERDWYLGDTYHVAIGQGDVLVTPLHVATWAQMIANDGSYCVPTFVQDKTRKTCTSLNISPQTRALVHEGMKEACSTGGTAWPLFNFEVGSPDEQTASDSAKPKKQIQLACKTGTAEFGHPKNKTHAWITAYAPADDPEITVTVLVEEGGEGSSHAGPVARDILKAWFESPK